MSQTSNILESASVTRFYIRVKFKNFMQIATIVADAFQFDTIEATPTRFPFKPIEIEDHYNSISRVLTIFFENPIPAESADYHLTITGLRSASGFDFDDETLLIPYNFENDTVTEPLEEPEFTIEDKSIKLVTISEPSSTTTASNDFFVVETDPENGSIFLRNDYNSGIIAVLFSKKPSVLYIGPRYVKVQRKKIGGLASRWENIDVITALDTEEPYMYIYMPSLDATPVYYESGRDYFEDGYKYRVLLSKQIAESL